MSEIFSKILKDKNGKTLNVGSKYQQPEWGVEENGVIFPETTLEVDANEGIAIIAVPFNHHPSAGTVCAVKYNGVDYECTAIEVPGGGLALGNVAAIGLEVAATDEPFALIIYSEDLAQSEGFYGMCVLLDGAASVVLSITGSVIHELPAKYIECASGSYVVEVSGSVREGATFNTPFADIRDAILSGKQVYAKLMETLEEIPVSSRVPFGSQIVFAGIKQVPFMDDKGTVLCVIGYAEDGTTKWVEHTLT